MRQIFGAHDLQDTITHREGIAQEIENVISNVAASWGVKVESILLKDIQFSKDLQENMSAAATARRLAAARIIQAESEVESAKLLREASDILDSKAAMQIRYLDTLKTMAREAGSKIIFMPPNAYGDKGSGGGGNNDNMKDLAAVALM
jgi:regulator of protease activity HflC (stomatin/prohibitin superfamily)